MTRILLTGGTGQVGTELRRLSWPEGVSLIAPTSAELDLLQVDELVDRVVALRPNAICNTAAYTNVDKAETDVVTAWKLNAEVPAHLAIAARELSVPMVHVSTDYVFGDGEGPRSEGHEAAPTSAYGASKRAGEIAALAAWSRLALIRTAWVISPWRHNFLRTMLRLATDRDTLRVVGDQRGCPTIAGDLAAGIQAVLERQLANPQAPSGIFHYVNGGEASWAELADAIMDEARRHSLPNAQVRAITTAEFPTPVKRPKDSRLSTARMQECFGVIPRHWREALADTVAQIAQEGEGR